MQNKIIQLEELVSELDKVALWLKELSNGNDLQYSRFNMLYQNVLKLVEYKKISSINNFINEFGFETYLFTLSDSFTFIDIFNAFHNKKGSIPKKLIRESFSGPFFPREEILGGANVNNRNLSFQLELASKFLSKKLEVIGYDDVILKFKTHKFYIECKRLLSENRVQENIQKAYEQLNDKISLPNDRGLIALTFDKLVGVDNKFLQVKNVEEIQTKLALIGNTFRNTYSFIWNNYLNIKVIGIILLIKFVAVLDESKVINCQQIEFISLRSDIMKSERNLLFELATVIS